MYDLCPAKANRDIKNDCQLFIEYFKTAEEIYLWVWLSCISHTN